MHIPRIRFLPETNLNTQYQHSLLISLLRGMAAIQVVAAHLRAQLYPSLKSLPDPTLGYTALSFFTGFAHQAVVIFFLLSGWLVGGSLLNRLREPAAMLSYAVDRTTRMWIVLVPAFLLTLVLAIVAKQVDPARVDFSVANHYSASTFVGNMFALQDLAVERYGGNFALWSLTYEIWYYVLFPLTLMIFTGRAFQTRVLALLATLLVAAHLNTAILLYFLLWLMGAAFSRVKIEATVPMRVAGFTLFAVIAAYFRLYGSNNILLEDSFVQDLVYSLLFLMCLCAMQNKTNLARAGMRLLSKAGIVIASFSFTLYVIHVPLLIVLRRAWAPQLNGGQLAPDSLGDFGMYLGMLATIVVLAYLFHLPFEAQTNRLRRFIKKLLGAGPPAQNMA